MAKETKKIKCVKCGKEKAEEDGMLIWEGKAFCCKACCNNDKKEDTEGLCEFC